MHQIYLLLVIEDYDSDDSMKDKDYQPDTAEGDLIKEEFINEDQTGDGEQLLSSDDDNERSNGNIHPENRSKSKKVYA